MSGINAVQESSYGSFFQKVEKSRQDILDENAGLREELSRLQNDLTELHSEFALLQEENARLSAEANRVQEVVPIPEPKIAKNFAYTIGYAMAKLVEAEVFQSANLNVKILFHKRSGEAKTPQNILFEQLKNIVKLPEDSPEKRTIKASKLAEFVDTIERYGRDNPFIKDITVKMRQCMELNNYHKFENPRQFGGKVGTKTKFT